MKSLRCIDLFEYVVNHPGVHGERETKGPVTLPKFTSAALQTAGPPAFTAHGEGEQGSGLQKFPEVVLSGMNTENIIVLVLTFPQGSGETEAEGRGRAAGNVALIGKVDFRLLSLTNSKLLSTALTALSRSEIRGTFVPEGHDEALSVRPDASKAHVVCV